MTFGLLGALSAAFGQPAGTAAASGAGALVKDVYNFASQTSKAMSDVSVTYRIGFLSMLLYTFSCACPRYDKLSGPFRK